MAATSETEGEVNVRKSARLASASRARVVKTDLGQSAIVKKEDGNRMSLLSAKILTQNYRWLSETCDVNSSTECDFDSHNYLDESSNSTTEYVEHESNPVDTCTDHPFPDIDEPLEELILPPSCDDLMVVNEHILHSLSIYEVLRRFYRPLRLTPFRVEDFCAALSLPDSSRLLDEVHIVLLRSAIRSDEGVGTMFTSVESKDSASILLFFGTSDPVTWFELCRQYLNCLPSSTLLRYVLEIFLNRSVYADVTVEERLAILQVLVDLFLSTESAREFLTSYNTEIVHENHCRSCNKVGDLLCCNTCPAVYHVECIKPPLFEIPEGDWICAICERNQVEGATDRESQVENIEPFFRLNSLGYDRHSRKYWFICRRLFVDCEKEAVHYYSSPVQLEQLKRVLGSNNRYHCEVELLSALDRMNDEIISCMNVTANLIDRFRGSRKAALHLHDELITKWSDENYCSSVSKETAISDTMESKEQNASRETNLQNNFEGCLKLESMTYLNNSMVTEDSVLDRSMNDVLKNDDSGPNAQCSNGYSKNDDSRHPDSELFNCDDGSGCNSVTPISLVADVNTSLADRTDLGKNVKEHRYKDSGSNAQCLNGDSSSDSEHFNGLDGSGFNSETSISHVKEPLQLVAESKTSLQDVEKKLNGFKAKTVCDKVDLSDEYYSATENSSPEKHDNNVFPSWSDKACPTPSSDSLPESEKNVLPVRVTRSMTGNLPISRRVSPLRVVQQPTTRTNRSKVCAPRTNIFKLGMEATFTRYVNYFRTDPLALSKVQKSEDREKRRQLTLKFSMLSPEGGDFSWQGPLYGNLGHKSLCVEALRDAMLSLETDIATPFLHSSWRLHGHAKRWTRAVQKCMTPEEFASALSSLVVCMKPAILNCTWREAFGHTSLHYSTAIEREEAKRKEREMKAYKLFEDDSWLVQSNVKYTLGLHHQVWKQKDEEYRIFGNGGWIWLSSTRVSRLCMVTRVKNLGFRTGKSRLNKLLEMRLQPLQSEAVVVESKASASPSQSAISNGSTCCYSATCKASEPSMNHCYSTCCKASKRKTCYSAQEQQNDCRKTNGVVVEGETESSRQQIIDDLCTKRSLTSKDLIVYHEDTRLPVILGHRSAPAVKKNTNEIPLVNKFLTRSLRTSIFVLESRHLHKLARRGSLRFDPPGFSSNFSSKCDHLGWPYPGPRPLFSTTWFYRTATARNLSAIALQLRVLRCCLLWDEMCAGRPSSLDEDPSAQVITMTQLKDKRDLEPDYLRSEYLVETTTIPVGVNSEPQGDRPASQRTGLRERICKIIEPVVTEAWTSEENIELWKLKEFADRGYRPRRQQAQKPVTSAEDSELIEEPLRRCSSRATNKIFDEHRDVTDRYEKIKSSHHQSSLRKEVAQRRVNPPSGDSLIARPDLVAAAVTKQNIRALTVDGKVIFTGLLPGQKMVPLEDGRYKLVVCKSELAAAACSSNAADWTTVNRNLLRKRSRSQTGSESSSSKRLRLSANEAREVLMNAMDENSESDDEIDTSEDVSSQHIAMEESMEGMASDVKNTTAPIALTAECQAIASYLEAKTGQQDAQQIKSVAASDHPAPIVRQTLDVPGLTVQAGSGSASTHQKKVSGSSAISCESYRSAEGSEFTSLVGFPADGDTSTEFHCLCRTRYDETKFYIGCHLCQSWFHGACVDVSIEAAKYMTHYLCPSCVNAGSVDPPRLYCICEMPYNRLQKYIRCSFCRNWFHPKCVLRANEWSRDISLFTCERCKASAPRTRKKLNTYRTQLSDDWWHQIEQLLKKIKLGSVVSHEFNLQIASFIDLSQVDERVKSRFYHHLEEFVEDILVQVTAVRRGEMSIQTPRTPKWRAAGVFEMMFTKEIANMRLTMASAKRNLSVAANSVE